MLNNYIPSNRSVRNLLVLITLFCFTGNVAFAGKGDQSPKADRKEKIEELRKKFFNEKLALSDAEQKVFWPLYNEYKQKEKALRDSFRSKFKPNDVIFMDDKKAEEFLNASIKLNEDQSNLFKEYMLKLKKVLPIKKVAMIPMIEKEFKREMLKQARMHRGKGGPGNKPAPAPPDEE